MKAVLFAGILLIVAGCATAQAVSTPTPTPVPDDAALKKCIQAIISNIATTEMGVGSSNKSRIVANACADFLDK